jgi:amino-acid N-acetyltransferase
LGKASQKRGGFQRLLRKATVDDVNAIQKLVNGHAQKGEMLPRSLGDICDNIRDFFIYEKDGNIVGCCALHVTWVDLAEIRSLAVASDYQRKGVGTDLLNACIEDAFKLSIKKLFALTYKPEFFEKKGFHKIDKSELPHKVWVACVNCIKFPDCDEIAVVKQLYDSDSKPVYSVENAMLSNGFVKNGDDSALVSPSNEE